MVNVLPPINTDPEVLPAKLMMEAPDVVPVRSRVALSMMLLEAAIEPAPVSDKVPPLIVVVPV